MKQRKLVIELIIYTAILLFGLIMLFTKKFDKPEFTIPDDYKLNAQQEMIDKAIREDDEDDTLFIE